MEGEVYHICDVVNHVPAGFADVTVKLRFTVVAAVNAALPGCAAVMLHGPGATSVIRPPAALHTLGVVEAIVTGNPELAFAATGNGEMP
jgi:hypothetical protein